MDLGGNVTLVARSARGIGQEIARGLGAAGGRIVAADISDGNATIEPWRAAGIPVIADRLDVRDVASAQEMAKAALAAFGRIGALINNATLDGSLRGGRLDAIAEARLGRGDERQRQRRRSLRNSRCGLAPIFPDGYQDQ